MSAITGLISFLLLCCIILPANPAVAAGGGNIAGGEVKVSKLLVAGQEVNVQDIQVISLGGGKPEHRLLKPGDSLLPGREIIAPARTVIIFTSSNGNLITLNPGSRLRVNTVSGEGESYTTLEGLFNFEVFKALSFFRVSYQTFVALVKGTQYSVEVEPGKEIRFTASQGKVEIIRDVKVKIEEGDKVVTGLKEAEVISAEGRRSVSYRLGVDEYLKVFKTYKDAEDYYRRQLEKALQSGDYGEIQMSRLNLGAILMVLSKLQESINYLEQGLQAAVNRVDREWECGFLIIIGLNYYAFGDYSRGIDYSNKALAKYYNIYPAGDDPSIAAIYMTLGVSYFGQGEYHLAIDHFEKALKIYFGNKMNNDDFLGIIYTALGIAYNELGKSYQAIDYIEKSIELGGNSLAQSGNYIALSRAYRSLGEFHKALGYAEKALAIQLKIFPDENNDSIAWNYHELGAIYWGLKEYRRAINYSEKALAIALKVFPGGLPTDYAATYNNLGAIYSELGENRQAIEYIEKGLSILLKTHPDGNHQLVGQAYDNLGTAYRGLREYRRAIEYHEKALAILLKLYPNGQHPYIAMSYDNLSKIYYSLGDNRKAEEYTRKAQEIRAKLEGK